MCYLSKLSNRLSAHSNSSSFTVFLTHSSLNLVLLTVTATPFTSSMYYHFFFLYAWFPKINYCLVSVRGFCRKMMTHKNYLSEKMWGKDLCNKVWADPRLTNMRWTENIRKLLLPRSLKGHGEREGARAQRELWFCGRGFLSRSCDLRQSGPVTVVRDQSRTVQENNDLDLPLPLTSYLLLGIRIGQTQLDGRRHRSPLTRSVWYILQGHTAR